MNKHEFTLFKPAFYTLTKDVSLLKYIYLYDTYAILAAVYPVLSELTSTLWIGITAEIKIKWSVLKQVLQAIQQWK